MSLLLPSQHITNKTIALTGNQTLSEISQHEHPITVPSCVHHPITSPCSQPTFRALYFSISAAWISKCCQHLRVRPIGRVSKFWRNLRLRLKMCGPKFAVEKNEILRKAKLEEAEALDRRTLEGREKVLGSEHADTLQSVRHLAGSTSNSRAGRRRRRPFGTSTSNERSGSSQSRRSSALSAASSVARHYRPLDDRTAT